MGSIGIGAPLLGANLDGCHVILFSTFCLTSGSIDGFGESRPGEVALVVTMTGDGAGASLDDPINDFLNQDAFEERVGWSTDSLDGRVVSSECFRKILDGVVDRGRRGSTASMKYSCCSACTDVGLFLGSHIKHLVTKSHKLAGHCGGSNIFSIATGDIYLRC